MNFVVVEFEWPLFYYKKLINNYEAVSQNRSSRQLTDLRWSHWRCSKGGKDLGFQGPSLTPMRGYQPRTKDPGLFYAQILIVIFCIFVLKMSTLSFDPY